MENINAFHTSSRMEFSVLLFAERGIFYWFLELFIGSKNLVELGML
jgi:hypothetical protein